MYEQDQLRAEACDRDVTPDRPQAQGGRRGGAISLASLPCLALLLLACPAPHSRLGGWCLLVACSLCVRDPIGSLVSLLAPDTPAGRPARKPPSQTTGSSLLSDTTAHCLRGGPAGRRAWLAVDVEGPACPRARGTTEARPPALHASRGEVTALSLCLSLEPWSVGHVCRAVNCSACRGRARPGTGNFFLL